MADLITPFLETVLGFSNLAAMEIVNVQGVNTPIEPKCLTNESVKTLCYTTHKPGEDKDEHVIPES